ncbi:MAG: hypothetical protein OXE81_10365 [Gammaproteobacteria bacterium]|nr:hypothetical protein [Gammaproteobacteria bacterium]
MASYAINLLFLVVVPWQGIVNDSESFADALDTELATSRANAIDRDHR